MSRIKRTMIAQAGFDFSAQFTLKFLDHKIPGDATYTPTLAPPEQDSTGGGKQAMQPIVLKAAGPTPTITVGWVKIADHQAQLRSYRCLQQVHAQRFPGRPFPLQQQAYEAFFREAQAWFGQHSINVTIQHQPPAPAGPASPAGTSTRKLAAYGCTIPVLLLSVAVIVLAYVWFNHRADVLRALSGTADGQKLAPGDASAE